MRYTTKRSIGGLLTIKKDLKAVMFGAVGHETPEDKYL